LLRAGQRVRLRPLGVERLWHGAVAAAPGDAYSTLPCVTPGGELLLHLGGWPRVRACLALIDAVEDLGIDPQAVSHDYWRHAHNRLIAGHRPRPYSLRRHRAWLLRRELGG
jgi:hypothetical protein